MAYLECNNISKNFGAVRALSNVSLDCEQGEVRAVLGGNGSGKSTLAKILGGSVFADTGTVTLDGRALALSSPIHSKRTGIVVTSQELSLLANLTVEENVMLCGLPRRAIFVDRAGLHRHARELLARFGLEKYAHSDIGDLSANQQYLVEFAKALMQKPRILVVDEITSALYRDSVAMVKDVIHELRDQGCCVLFISHRMNEIYDICDSVSVMRNGEHVNTLALTAVNEETLLTMMSGQDVQKVTSTSASYQTEAGGQSFLSVRGHRLKNFAAAIDLDVAKGEIVGIAGLQGNGQSGLVRSLFALEGPVKLAMAGSETVIHSAKHAVRSGFAFVSGDREREGTFAIRSIMENAGAVAELVLGRKGVEKERALADYRVRMGSPFAPIRALSGGNRQKVVLARWTTANPAVLLADDPTKGIDVNARREVHQFIRALAARGAAILFVSSDSEELVELTRSHGQARVLIMYGGQIIHTLRGDDITAENIAYHEVPKGAESHGIR